jgi:hypothetical protein
LAASGDDPAAVVIACAAVEVCSAGIELADEDP